MEEGRTPPKDNQQSKVVYIDKKNENYDANVQEMSEKIYTDAEYRK